MCVACLMRLTFTLIVIWCAYSHCLAAALAQGVSKGHPGVGNLNEILDTSGKTDNHHWSIVILKVSEKSITQYHGYHEHPRVSRIIMWISQNEIFNLDCTISESFWWADFKNAKIFNFWQFFPLLVAVLNLLHWN